MISQTNAKNTLHRDPSRTTHRGDRARTLLPGIALVLACMGCQDRAEEMSADNAAEAAGAVEVQLPSFDDPNLAPLDIPASDVVFEPVANLVQQSVEVQGALRQAVIATPRDWPASFYIVFQSPRGQSSCTAALIGPEVMLTAAHCVPASGAVSYRAGGRTLEMNCQRHPDWETGRDASADYAMCRLPEPYPQPVGFEFETVDLSSISGLTSAPVLLSGYGCVSDRVADTRSDGAYRIGVNSIKETSLSTNPTRSAKYYAATGQKNNLITREDGTNLCPGDSGGPAFRRTEVAADSRFAKRKIIGVNSRVFYRDPQAQYYGASLVSGTGTQSFAGWGRKWLTDRSLAACGLLGTIPNCRV